MRTAVAIVLLLAVAGPAAADPKVDAARAHYKAGQSHFAAGRWDRAIEEFKAAYDLSQRPLLLYNIGSAYRRRGETSGAVDDKRAALDHYRRYLAAEPNGKAAHDAQDYVATLAREVEAADAAARPEPAPAPPEPVPPPAVAAEAPVQPPPAPQPPADRPSDPRRTMRIAGLVTGGVGVVLVGAGVYFGLKAKSLNDELAGLTPGQPWDQDKYDSAQADERNMYIFLGTGAAAIAGGAIMYFVLGKPVRVTPEISSGRLGLNVAGRF